MAIRYISAAACALCFTATAAQATVYHATFCDDPAACHIAPPQGAPAGFPDISAQINAFYAPFNPVMPLSYFVTGSNSQGVAYGQAWEDLGQIDAQFVYRDGDIICCTFDAPYRLAALNDSGVFIGRDSNSILFVSSEITDHEVVPYVPMLDAESAEAFGSSLYSWMTEIRAIDGAGRISGIGGPTGSFLLEPIALQVAEPGSMGALLGALAGLSMLRRRRHVHGT